MGLTATQRSEEDDIRVGWGKSSALYLAIPRELVERELTDPSAALLLAEGRVRLVDAMQLPSVRPHRSLCIFQRMDRLCVVLSNHILKPRCIQAQRKVQVARFPPRPHRARFAAHAP